MNVILTQSEAKGKDLELPTDPHPSVKGIEVVAGCF
jgi:hypothetical protein